MKKIFLFLGLFIIPHLTFSFNYFLTVYGKRYFGDIKQETQKYFIVELENEDRIIEILKENIILIEHEENGVEIFKSEYIDSVNPNTAVSPFFSKKNNIYIPMSSTKIAQRSGSGTLKMLLVNDSLWNIVDTEEQAHFIMRYVFDDRGSDKAYIEVKDRMGKKVYMSPKVSARDFVPWHAGEESAEKLYKIINRVTKKKK